MQRSKRTYVLQKQTDIENLEATIPNLFWKEIGKIGIGQERRKFIPMAVILDDGSISSVTGEVLNKSKDSFETLLNPVNGNVENICENHPANDSRADAPLCFTEHIHLSEIELGVVVDGANRDFMQKPSTEKLCFILENPDDYIVRQTTKFCAEV